MLLGRNGAGKSTVMKTLIGLVRPASGRIVFDGEAIAGHPPFAIARAGLGYVPEERRIFTNLTVMENLQVGRQPARGNLPAVDAGAAVLRCSPISARCATGPASA